MRGGPGRGQGRKPGSKDKKPRKKAEMSEKEKIKQILALGEKAKARFYQEFLIRVANQDGQQAPLTMAEKRLMAQLGAELSAGIAEKAPPEQQPGEDMEAADYLRKVWNDPSIDATLRIRAAEIVFKEGGGKGKGKKDEKADRAKQAGSGKFSASAPPQLKVVGK